MTETFKEALLLSNKTYFLEEMSKQKLKGKNLKKEVDVQNQKIKLLNDNVKRLENLNQSLTLDNERIEQELTEALKNVAKSQAQTHY